jgi:Fe-S oxidoreductase
LLTLRDEFMTMLPGAQTSALSEHAFLFEEFVAIEIDAGRWNLDLQPLASEAYVHGHCHQKAFGAMTAVEKTLRLIPGLDVHVIESSCCGMAGSFGYEIDHYDVSMKMAERTLLPAVRTMPEGALLVTDGLSCRHQIEHGTKKRAEHVASVLAAALRQVNP